MSAAGGSLSCTLTVGLSLEGPPVSGTEAREPQVPEKEEHHLARASEDLTPPHLRPVAPMLARTNLVPTAPAE